MSILNLGSRLDSRDLIDRLAALGVADWRDFAASRDDVDSGDRAEALALIGAGFWDRGAGSVGERLSEAAKLHGYFSVYVASDGAPSVHEG